MTRGNECRPTDPVVSVGRCRTEISRSQTIFRFSRSDTRVAKALHRAVGAPCRLLSEPDG
jgi:hypothetical protein